MESFDMFLNGNFVALPAFQKHYGVHVEGHGWTIPTRWQSALFQAGQCGAFVGVFVAGPITNRFGYRWTTIFALMLMNATIFISFFVSPAIIFAVKVSSNGSFCRPIRSNSSSSDKHWKVSHGASSSPTLLPTLLRSSLFRFEVLVQLHYR